ncbi:MAG: TetR family transcriptional regulator [Roseateles depolymerans]|uniref:TetR family transcriptional regulator n=1 Tax=Roseateles depolymerans TaxID=76731 RepID=A0A2W5E0V3_9BURK|nr:MAG: TetR family transcriptional regulator [Roseateles depolymerans]
MATDSRPTRKELSHERIVDAAARALSVSGLQGVGVADVMKQAGLTHGGFYAHFESRDALLAEAVQHASTQAAGRMRQRVREGVARGVSPLRAVIEAYLSERHVQHPEQGCPIPNLASDIPRQSEPLRELANQRIQQIVRALEEALPPGEPPEGALVIAATLVGTVQLARALGPGERASTLLAETTRSLLQRYDRAAAAPA